MAVPVEAVQVWAIGEQRIGHVVYAIRQGTWVSTLCDKWGPSFDVQTEMPPRICAACRARLKEARLKPSK